MTSRESMFSLKCKQHCVPIVYFKVFFFFLWGGGGGGVVVVVVVFCKCTENLNIFSLMHFLKKNKINKNKNKMIINRYIIIEYNLDCKNNPAGTQR